MNTTEIRMHCTAVLYRTSGVRVAFVKASGKGKAEIEFPPGDVSFEPGKTYTFLVAEEVKPEVTP